MMCDKTVSSTQSGSSANQSLPLGYSQTASESSSQENNDIQSVIFKQLDEQSKKIEKLNKKVDLSNSNIRKFEKEMHDISNRNIEVIGVFSSVVAFLIINANIITRTESLIQALVLIVAFTCSIAVFCALIHHFFSSGENKLGKSFYCPIIILVLLMAICLSVEHRQLKESNQDLVEKDVPSKTSFEIPPRNVLVPSFQQGNVK